MKWRTIKKLLKGGFLQIDLPDEYPVIDMTHEQKEQLVKETMQTLVKPALITYKICNLSSHMSAIVYNEPSNEYFELTFKKIEEPSKQ